MNNIKWQDGAVCYFAKKQWFPNNGALGGMLKGDIHHYNYGDFQLNEIREGYFIPASELDTEQKYNEVVEVFGLFGFAASVDHRGFCASNPLGLVICDDGYAYTNEYIKRKLTYHQIIAIGKLKRMMLERENIERQSSYCRCKQVALSVDDKPNNPEMSDSSKRRNKSKQAYDILKSLDYEYDLVKQKWYKKEYID